MENRVENKVENKVVLITGASRGLGRTLAHFWAAQAANLILTARGAAALQAVADEIGDVAQRVCVVPGDIRDGAHRQQLAAVVAEFGRLDLLVNNASILGPSPQPTLAAYPLETLEQVLEVNVLAPLGLIQATLPWLQKARGTVVNISSDAAVGGYAGWGGYGASKAALDLVSATLATELAATEIAVVAVDPGDMRTQMHQEAFPGEDISDRPLPEATLPFWAWLRGQDPQQISGRRFRAQAETWMVA